MSGLHSIFWLSFAGFALTACVGSESDQSSSASNEEPPVAQEEETHEGPRVLEISQEAIDTVSPIRYTVFREAVESEKPRKLMFHAAALEPGNPERWAATLRGALDSLAQADTMLVAARAVMFTIGEVQGRVGKLVPVVWAEWVPPVGWDQATPASRETVHRTYIYHGRPQWPTMPDESVELPGG
jgi:hypothetical protein